MAYDSQSDDTEAAVNIDELRDGSDGTVARLKRRVGITEDQSNLMGFLFVAPNIAVFSIFLLGPVLYAFYLAFMEYSILTHESAYVGLENFYAVMQPYPWENGFEALRDPTTNTWWFSLRNTFVYAIGTVPLQILGGLAVALMLDKRVRAKKAYRAAYFMPVMLSGAAAAVIWRWLLADTGIINEFLRPLDLAYAWASSPDSALGALMLIGLWGGIGFNMILYLAGLQNIPEELYEAARIDGATGWQRMRYVTWPNLRNTHFFVTILAIIGTFQVFGIALAFSQGGPARATTTIVVLIYEVAFQQSSFGRASAMAFLLFAVVFVFSYWRYRMEQQEEVGY